MYIFIIILCTSIIYLYNATNDDWLCFVANATAAAAYLSLVLPLLSAYSLVVDHVLVIEFSLQYRLLPYLAANESQHTTTHTLSGDKER